MGTIGWVSSGIFSMVAIRVFKVQMFDGSILPLYCGVGVAVFTALFNLFLPKTPPTVSKSAKYSIQDIFGLRIISTLKNKHFNRFILISFLATIPFALFYSYGSLFLQDENFKYITITMNWRQVAELFFLFITTSILVKYGFKNTLIFGLVALFIQYISFYLGVALGLQWLYYFGILPHGLTFGLFYVAGRVYTDKVVPQEFKAQAQGFLSFVIWGLGILAGNLICGWMIDEFKTNHQTNWSLLFAIASVSTVVLILLFSMFFKNPPQLENNDTN
jgi:MFS family permease